MGVRCLVGLALSDACLRHPWLEAQLWLGRRLGTKGKGWCQAARWSWGIIRSVSKQAMPQEENARDWTLVQRFRKSRAATNTAANQRPAGGLARQAFGMSVEAPARGCGVRRWAAVGAQAVVVVEVAHQRTTWAGTVVGTWAAPERVSLSHGGARPLQRRKDADKTASDTHPWPTAIVPPSTQNDAKSELCGRGWGSTCETPSVLGG